MLYKPSRGRFKDNCVFWHNNRYYLFSMYSKELGGSDQTCYHVWLATSCDGVHWKDIGPVIEDAPFLIYAMAVHQVEDRFILNHGSFTAPGKQNVIRFWESKDLETWTWMGEEFDLKPDARWYDPDSRLDCMNVIEKKEGDTTKYYGYATGVGGFLHSDDGIHWDGMPHPKIEWQGIPAPRTLKGDGYFEVGGCHEINGKYYWLGGWTNYQGYFGYGVYTFIGDTPTGPFRPDPIAYRLCGNSERWVSLWARYCRTDQELLISSYMYDGYTYERGATWMPLLKKAVVDKHEHLRLGYWSGNDAVKGKCIAISLENCIMEYPAKKDAKIEVSGNQIKIEAIPEKYSFERTDLSTTIVFLNNNFDMGKGIVLEGSLQATCKREWVSPDIGFCLEEKNQEGTAIMLETSGLTQIGRLNWKDRIAFECEDRIGFGCAAVAGITPHEFHTFRLFIRKNMFELYIDDMLIQTFNTTHKLESIGLTPQRIGFIVQNGRGIFKDIKAWQMNL